VIAGAKAGALVRTPHREWYRELFQPCVTAGLIEAGALAGYRNNAVYLRTSPYVPPRWEAVRDAVPTLFDLLEREPEASVRAVLGHWMFGYIHPYPDGNSRMARFLMNAMLASGGYRGRSSGLRIATPNGSSRRHRSRSPSRRNRDGS
jgi:Fic family protein